MIVIMKKSNILMVGLIIILIAAIYSLNFMPGNEASTFGSPKAKTVVVDAGHGGEDPGAVSSYSGLKEKELSLKIAFYLKEELENAGYKVVMTRTEDVLQYSEGTKRIYDKRKQDLTRRKQIMDENSDGAVVSIHLNKFEQTQYYGAQSFFPPGSDDSKKLAVCVQNSLVQILKPEHKRVALVKNEEIIIFRNLKTPTALIEVGFLSNETEEKRLGTEEYQRQIAEAIKLGIDEFFK